jgi:hypothetical protein
MGACVRAGVVGGPGSRLAPRPPRGGGKVMGADRADGVSATFRSVGHDGWRWERLRLEDVGHPGAVSRLLDPRRAWGVTSASD